MSIITIINGPNLNLLGQRETGIYGATSFETFLEELKQQFPGVEFRYYQSNIEGELVTAIQEAGRVADGIVLNPAAYTHTSVAIGDAIASIQKPVVEVHISNIYTREDFRKISHVSAKAVGSIIGLGLPGYKLAVDFLMNRENG
jgi:3-dehydroquinate dehydratase-2